MLLLVRVALERDEGRVLCVVMFRSGLFLDVSVAAAIAVILILVCKYVHILLDMFAAMIVARSIEIVEQVVHLQVQLKVIPAVLFVYAVEGSAPFEFRFEQRADKEVVFTDHLIAQHGVAPLVALKLLARERLLVIVLVGRCD